MSSLKKEKNSADAFQPVFIVGASRSGTTMMGRIVGNSNTIFTFHELHFFEQLWSPETGESSTSSIPEKQAVWLGARLLSIQRDGYLSQNSPTHYLAESAKMLADKNRGQEMLCLSAPQVFLKFLLYESSKSGCAIPCDQTPRNVFYLREIFNLYPNARVIIMIRDPRDVLLSQKGKWKLRFLGAKNIPLREALRAKVNYHSVLMSKLWSSAVNAADSFIHDTRVHVVIFEDLLTKPEKSIQNVCSFLRIPYHSTLLNIPQVDSSNSIRQPEKRGVNAEVANNFRKIDGLSDTEIFWCQKINKNVMKKYGYTVHAVRPNPFILLLDVLVLPLQLTFALVLNIRRMRNIISTIKKRLQ